VNPCSLVRSGIRDQNSGEFVAHRSEQRPMIPHGPCSQTCWSLRPQIVQGLQPSAASVEEVGVFAFLPTMAAHVSCDKGTCGAL
jgi:hypothetical protein